MFRNEFHFEVMVVLTISNIVIFFVIYRHFWPNVIPLSYDNFLTINKTQQQGIWNQKWKISSADNCACYKYDNLVNIPKNGAWLNLIQKYSTAEEKLEMMALEIENQLNYLNGKTNCSAGPTLYCGHFQSCGLACQLAHRTTCLLLSYTMGIPLIHSSMADGWWRYSTPWEHLYKRLGSTCKVDDHTIIVTWRKVGGPKLEFAKPCRGKGHAASCAEKPRIPIPFQNGIPVAKEMLDILEKLHKDPFLWYVGQFVKYTVRYSAKMERVIAGRAKEMGLVESPPFAGIHVRRTDKLSETMDSRHKLSEYMNILENYFSAKKRKHSGSRMVYLASDDHTVLAEAQKRYKPPKWKIVGFQTNTTLMNADKRWNKEALLSIITDMHFLAQSEFLVCGLSSNVCRKLLELMSTRFTDLDSKISSLDGQYVYEIVGFKVPIKLIPF